VVGIARRAVHCAARAAGTLRDFWLATDQRPPDHPPRVVAEAANADEAFELIAAGVGVALVSAGNARIYQRPGARSIAVSRLSPSELAIARRRDDRRRAVLDFVTAAVAASAPRDESGRCATSQRVWAASTPSDLAGGAPSWQGRVRRDTLGGVIGLAARSDDATAGFAGNLTHGKPEQVRPDGVRIASMTEPIAAAGALLVVAELPSSSRSWPTSNSRTGCGGRSPRGILQIETGSTGTGTNIGTSIWARSERRRS
jgi:hypothetical protein